MNFLSPNIRCFPSFVSNKILNADHEGVKLMHAYLELSAYLYYILKMEVSEIEN